MKPNTTKGTPANQKGGLWEVAVKRYLVFAGEDYYPVGGWGDFQQSFDTQPDALACAQEHEKEGKWTHVIDLGTGRQVE